MEGLFGITCGCNARCQVCNTWKYPTEKEKEIEVEYLEKLPEMRSANITGGEPLLREDIDITAKVIREKSKRIVISTNGFFTEKIIDLAEKNKDIGMRISIEALTKANDELRGIKGGFDRGLRTLIELKHMGMKDIGFGVTVSDKNAKDLLALYKLACAMKVEFATATVHNSYYFHKVDNEIVDQEMIAGEFRKLVKEFLKTKTVENWYRAYFNYGIINYI